MKKVLIISGIIILLIIIAVAAMYYWIMNTSFYTPGELANQAVIVPDQAGVKNSYWKVADNIELYYFTQGQGQTPVLMIHGGPGMPFTSSWPGLDKLGDQYKFYYYQQRGSGQSTRPIDKFESQNYYQNMKDLETQLGFSQQLLDIERIRQLLKQDKLTIIGHSFGGLIATFYAVEFPEHVDKMVLVAPAGMLKMPNDDQDNLFSQLQELLSENDKQAYLDWQDEYFDYKNLFKKSDVDLAGLNYQFVDFYQKAQEAEGKTLPESALGSREDMAGFGVHAIYLSLGMKYDYRAELGKIKSPVLIIHGADDYALSVSEEYASLLPNSELKIVKNAGHFPFTQNSEEFLSIVKDFLSK